MGIVLGGAIYIGSTTWDDNYGESHPIYHTNPLECLVSGTETITVKPEHGNATSSRTFEVTCSQNLSPIPKSIQSEAVGMETSYLATTPSRHEVAFEDILATQHVSDGDTFTCLWAWKEKRYHFRSVTYDALGPQDCEFRPHHS